MLKLDLESCFALFENNFDASGHLFVLTDLAFRIVAKKLDQLIESFNAIDQAIRQGLWAAVAVSYEAGYGLEPRFGTLQPPAETPLLQAWIFRLRTDATAAEREIWWQRTLDSLPSQQREAGILRLAPAWDETQHSASVRRILDFIRAGDCYQVNLTFPFHGLIHGHPLALFHRLRQTQPVPYGAAIHDEGQWILSRSPELFFAREGEQLRAQPMKGTAARTGNDAEDANRRSSLLDSTKDRAENLMIVDLIRNDLGKLAPPGGVKVPRLFDLETYKTVYQLTSTISAEPVRCSTAETFSALFPCGSITGAPKIRAMEVIQSLEDQPRGLYCGALGWISPENSQCFSVPIRTLLVSADRHCRLDVGSGVVADSRPLDEYEECLAKAAFARSLIIEFGLIETMLWSPVTEIALLPLHLQRLERSARALDFTIDVKRIRMVLRNTVENLPRSPHRVRLVLLRDGSLDVKTGLLNPLDTEIRVCVAANPLDERDPKLRFKTTARTFYDEALKAATQKGFFDVLFFNTRGELCEGARSNVFIEKSGTLYTPALPSGLLPGVLRQHLLNTGKVEERVLSRRDLEGADRIFVGNALRGMLKVQVHLGDQA